ncbi:MAG: Holliday junction branch migration protein RuvA [Candidatus Poribacteria bacterium]|nr:Holliday junction branch migration protein RuvA [Candidatus Poribacteria bacterium]
MIAFVRGTLEEIGEDGVVLDVNGVGYEVFISKRTLGELTHLGGEMRLFTHDVIRENEHALFGFGTREERELFQVLIEISGVGPRTALNVMSIMSPKEFLVAVQEGNVISIARAQGIGKKTAQRIIVDLQNKVGALQPLALGTGTTTGVRGEATQALIALGASDMVADQAVRAAMESLPDDAAVEQIVAAALRLTRARGART